MPESRAGTARERVGTAPAGTLPHPSGTRGLGAILFQATQPEES